MPTTAFRKNFFCPQLQTLAVLAMLGISMAAVPAHARQVTSTKAGKSGKAAVAAPVNAGAQGDYIVAVVNSEPITNREVQLRAQALARALAASHAKVPDRAGLLKQALNDAIVNKATVQSARTSGMVLTDEDISVAEEGMAREQGVSAAEFRNRVMAERKLTQAQYRKGLTDQMVLERVREARMKAAADKVTDQEAMQWLREQQQKQGAAAGPAQRMLNLAQVLVAVPKGADAAEVQQLQAKAEEALRKIRRGENFASVVKVYTDASGRDTGGAMGLLPESAYPAEFTTAVQSTPAGQTTGIVRSVAGFHILKVLERQQTVPGMAVEQTHARHILLRPDAKLSAAQATARLAEVRQRIAAGKLDFAAAARELSQDGTADKGGDLGWTAPGQFVPEFEEVVGKLQPGQISAPFASRYGVHVVQLLERRAVPMTQEQQLAAARKVLQARKAADALRQWEEEIRGQAYVEMREPPR